MTIIETEPIEVIINAVLTCTHCGAFNTFEEQGMGGYVQSMTVDVLTGELKWGEFEILEGTEVDQVYVCSECNMAVSFEQREDMSELSGVVGGDTPVHTLYIVRDGGYDGEHDDGV